MRFGMGRGARGCCGRASLLSGTSLGRGHPQPEAPPSRPALTGLRAPALGPGGLELRRGLGGQSGADPGSRLPAPCDGVRGPRGAGRSPAEEQRSAVFVILFALITILILYSSNSANEVFHYGSLRGRTRRPVNLKKWSFSSAYFPILGNKTLPSRCNQCVIITSSSHLLGTKLGPEIERAECTIRMNDAPTSGYSADVGNKTTFRVVAHSSVFRVLRKPQEFVNRTPETVFIFWGPPNKMQKPQGSLLRVIQRAGLMFPNMEAYAVSPARMQQFDDLFRGETGKDREKSHSWLSTGWFTMVIAVELCDHVHVYGMVPPDYCSQRPRLQRMPYHYYEPKGPDECVTYIQNEHSRKGNHHRFITEKRVFSSWAQLYGITFSHPSWT
uniref:Alpha-N-acetylgalactosaminide alpha-2,6-sialyltransferase 6 n=1 Tax=Mus spicilegus TaxID=10103 RepID=A0A8C6GWE4_MUSSI